MATVAEALGELKITEWVLRGAPKTEDEFKSMFTKVTGATADGTGIESSDHLSLVSPTPNSFITSIVSGNKYTRGLFELLNII